MDNKTKKLRDSNIELLRIVTMFMIMLHHFCAHSGFSFDNSLITIPRLWVSFITMGGKLGVDIFVLISGYYLSINKELKPNIKRIFKFWFEVFFYSVAMTGIYMLINRDGITTSEIIYSFLPMASEKWWFISTYFVLYLLHPYLNRLLHNLNKKEHLNLVIFLLVLWVGLPLVFKAGYQGNELTWFITLYCIAAYIRLHGLPDKYAFKHYALASLVITIILYGLTIAMLFAGKYNEYLAGRVYRFYEMKHPGIILLSISIFMTFLKMDIPYNKTINKIASTVFAIYLIHDNMFYREIWWQRVFHGNQFQSSLFLIPHSLLTVFALFSLCALIDLIRQFLVRHALSSN